MQTFLPYASFDRSVACLDRMHLGKQRSEALQILRALDRSRDYGWRNHPAVRMWRGYPVALAMYGVNACEEWVARGYQDTVASTIIEEAARGDFERADSLVPPWLGDEAFHLSHRSQLARKRPEYYGRLFGPVPEVPYVWPVAS